MSDTASERQTGIEPHGGEPSGSVEPAPRSPGSRSLRAGGEFLKALAADLMALASWLRRSLPAPHRRTPQPRASAPSRPSWGAACGRLLWRLSLVLLGFGTILAGALSAVMLWVLFGFPGEPQKNNPEAPALSFEARKGEPLGPLGPLKAGDASRPELGHEAKAQDRPAGEAALPSMAASAASPPKQSGSSSPDAAAPPKTTKEPRIDPAAGADQRQFARTETPDRRPAAPQPEVSGNLTDWRPPTRCNVDLCAATYKSFHAADCTYQPYHGASRSVCELGPGSAGGSPTSPSATLPRAEPTEMRVAERPAEAPKSAMPAWAGGQCNISQCAATYASFHAADCTYQPHGGGPRRICER